jgi:hypothetical protein
MGDRMAKLSTLCQRHLKESERKGIEKIWGRKDSSKKFSIQNPTFK